MAMAMARASRIVAAKFGRWSRKTTSDNSTSAAFHISQFLSCGRPREALCELSGGVKSFKNGMCAPARNFLNTAVRDYLERDRTGFGHPLTFVAVRQYAKRPKKWQGGPYAWIQVPEGQPCPPSQPNEGSVKNRNQKKRMAQRDAFIKAQAQIRKKQTKAAIAARDIARRKRWREGAARARAWKQQQAKLLASSG